jgi:hypothetical protein
MAGWGNSGMKLHVISEILTAVKIQTGRPGSGVL